MEIEYRKATMDDLNAIVAFVDYWLTGGAKIDKIPGAGHDYFVRFGQQKSYLTKYDVLLATCEGEIVGWAVKTNKGVLIHLLVAATFRGKGIGGQMLRRMNPELVRSKFDQESGDPLEFYRKRGYVKEVPGRVGKKLNIDVLVKEGVGKVVETVNQGDAGKDSLGEIDMVSRANGKRYRSIDAVTARLKKGVTLGG